MQEQVHATIDQTKRRSGWSARRTLAGLGVSPASYYRWRRMASLRDAQGLYGSTTPTIQVFEATNEEKQAVRAYALKHPGIRHRELAWRMVDEDVAYLSPSTIYRILRRENLVSPWRRRAKRTREEDERASRPDEIWATDVMYLDVNGRKYFLLSMIDDTEVTATA